MTDARVRTRRSVRVAATALGAALALSGAAHAEEAAGSASISLGGGAAASGSSSAAPTSEGSSDAAADQPHAEEPVDWRTKNPAQYEFAFVSVGASQSWSLIGTVLFFGLGGGIGPPLYRIGKLNTQSGISWDHDLEIAYANAFLRVAPVPYVDIAFGPKIALGSALFGVPDAPQSSFSYGGYVDLRVGSPNIKVGPRFEYDRIAHSDFYEHGWRLEPLMVSVVH
jgi:hypothetical protein